MIPPIVNLIFDGEWMCVCVCERERDRERETERECVCLCVCERERGTGQNSSSGVCRVYSDWNIFLPVWFSISLSLTRARTHTHSLCVPQSLHKAERERLAGLREKSGRPWHWNQEITVVEKSFSHPLYLCTSVCLSVCPSVPSLVPKFICGISHPSYTHPSVCPSVTRVSVYLISF